MRRARCLAALLVLVAVPAAGRDRPHRDACPGEVAAEIAEHCPCDGASSHGQYVSCLVRFGNALRKAGCLDGTELASIRCAARSTCGKTTAVICCAAGACNPRACGVARDERACGAAGRVSVGKGSVCDTCAGSSTTSSTVTTTTSTSSTSTTASTTATTSTATTSTTLAAGVTYGNDVEFAAASAHAPDYLLGSPIVLPE